MKKKQILIEKYIEPSEIEPGTTFFLGIKRWFDKNYDLHSFLGNPAEIRYSPSGQILGQKWFKKGIIHRDRDLPAYISYHNNGQIDYQDWYKNGKLIKHL
jgi:antitoxin component YwqK of YwqJK toxin-antitoxin module